MFVIQDAFFCHCLIQVAALELFVCTLQSFAGLSDKPLMVDLTVEEGQRLKVIYGSSRGFHAIDLDTSSVFDIYIPAHVCSPKFIYVCIFLLTNKFFCCSDRVFMWNLKKKILFLWVCIVVITFMDVFC